MTHLSRYSRIIAALLCLAGALVASEHRGQVVFGGVPVPGATVTATQGEKKLATVTDEIGVYLFPDLADGVWTVKVEMLTFTPQTKEVGVAAGAPPAIWELALLPLEQMKAIATPVAPATAPATAPTPGAAAPQTATAALDNKNKKSNDKKKSAAATPQAGFQRADVTASAAIPPPGQDANAIAGADTSQDATNPFVVNGSASTGIERRAIGNTRRGFRSRYNGALNVVVDNSALDARPFSMTGQDTQRSPYNHGQYGGSFGGPLTIPGIIKRNAQFFVSYQAGRNRNSSTLTGLMPSDELRNMIVSNPTDPISQQTARNLLKLYPEPNSPLTSGYNYQIGATGVSDSDEVQARVSKTLNMKNFMVVQFAWRRGDSTSPNIFGFTDNTHTNGMNLTGNWRRTFGTRLQAGITYTYSRSATLTTPYFANRQNLSGDAGIAGNDQTPVNYGPPTLQFSSGIQSLTDAQASFTRNSTGALGLSGTWMHSPHTIQFGGDFRRQQFNLFSQQDPRGVLTFTSDATGSDFQHFLQGRPDAVSIAYGNADKYLRSNMWDAFFNDDWRVLPGFTLNAGLRWNYGSPITERYGRLVNLDIAPGFTSAKPVVGYNPAGPLTGQSYPGSLVRPDRHGFQPSVGIAWHPFAAGSMVVRAGYGLAFNTSVYQSIAMQMAQQSPLSTNVSVQNSAALGLTLANPFPSRSQLANTLPTFGIDPNYLVGYAQNWQVQAQQDVTASTVMTLTYLGIKGTRGTQVSMPNTYPSGAVNPCPACPSGFKYVTSNGNSTREAGTIALRRRLHNGIAASMQYTYSHSFDDAVMSGQGQLLAQNWLNLSAERGPSSFDQRHLASLTAQYTSGMGLAGGALLRGWKGAAFKGWTLQSTISAGTGLPETPIYFAEVTGTATTGSLRPQATGVSVNTPVAGRALNLAAYQAPLPGQWGNAGRNSITGPSQFSLNASLARSFDRFDLRFDSTNALNHVTYTGYNTTTNSSFNSVSQFGLPVSANAMRNVQATLRWRF